MRFERVGFKYARNAPPVLEGIDAGVGPGEVVVVEGRNGVGKSTLLQVAVGVLRPTAGRVSGRPRVVGWVPERFPAEQPFTVGRYLHAVAGMRGLSGATAAHTVRRWTQRLGIDGFSETRLPDLSKGTAQKVGLAQALLVPPELLVLDEPWEGLDAESRGLVPSIVAEVRGAGGAVLVSDHRGEAPWLPGAIRWSLSAAGLSVVPHKPISFGYGR